MTKPEIRMPKEYRNPKPEVTSHGTSARFDSEFDLRTSFGIRVWPMSSVTPKHGHGTLLLAEVRESFSMAMNAVTAHKLRSALTLLGVLIGVFSIIVVMTAMRVLQSRVEAQISSLGSQTFMIRKWPAIFFTLPEGIEKIRRRKNITLQQGLRFQEKVALAQSVGIQAYFWAGEIQTAHAKTAPNVQMLGETPGGFSARNWTLSDGRILADTDVQGVRDVCVLGNTLA